MPTLTTDQRVLRNALIAEADRRYPGDYQRAIRTGVRQFRHAQRRGLDEAMGIDTSTNQLNGPAGDDADADAGGNSFEVFLAQIIALIAQKAGTDGLANPAYAKLAAALAAAQAASMNVAQASYVSPAAGSTPVGRTGESAAMKMLSEALSYAGAGVAPRQAPARRPAAPVKPLDQMTDLELKRETIGRLAVLHGEHGLAAPFYARTA